ncbi:MAG TPA: LPP20 family lipoprotein [Bacteroidota bacterium]
MKTLCSRILLTAFLGIIPVLSISQPAWVEKRPVNPLYYLGIGVAQKEKGSTDYIQKAKDNALNDLASGITVTVSSEIMRKVVETNASIEDNFKSQIQTSAKAELEGVEWVDTYDGDGQYWVYCRISKEAYEAAKQRRIKNAMKLSLDLYQSGQRFEKENNVARALTYYVQSLSPLEKYLGEPLETEIGGKKVILVNEIFSSLQNLLGQIELKSVNPKQDGKVGMPLKLPFEVTAALTGTTPGPVAALPLKFAFIRGSGEMVDNSLTDNTGDAKCDIHKITATDKIQIVEAKIFLAGMISADSSSLILSAVLNSLSVPSARMVLSVTGLQVYVDADESQFGSKMKQPRIETAIKNKMVEKGFAFTNDMANASVVINIKADSRRGSETMGLCVSYVDATVSVLDMRSGEEIYKNAMNNVKGISDTFEKGAFKAFDEAAKNIVDGLLPKLVEKIQK